MIAYVLGNGLTSLEGAQHARQKRVIAPTFSNDNLIALLPIFFGKARELKGRWNGVLSEIPNGTKLDVCSWSSRATIDVIGLAGMYFCILLGYAILMIFASIWLRIRCHSIRDE